MTVVKMLFLDCRDSEIVEGFTRAVQPPRKFQHNPILLPDHPVDGDWMSLYGFVI
jgi:hypothetical protein